MVAQIWVPVQKNSCFHHLRAVEFSDFSMDIEADLSDESPKTYTDVKITYIIRVKEEDQDKVKKAVTLSKEKYCGVSAMFSQFADMDYEILFL
jgi:putative redox protein